MDRLSFQHLTIILFFFYNLWLFFNEKKRNSRIIYSKWETHNDFVLVNLEYSLTMTEPVIIPATEKQTATVSGRFPKM